MKINVSRWWLAGFLIATQGCALVRGPAVGEVVIRSGAGAEPVACVVSGNASPERGDRLYAERRLRPVPAVPSARSRTASASGELVAPIGQDCWTYTAGVGRFIDGQRVRIHGDG
jgi:hypothetical protein